MKDEGELEIDDVRVEGRGQLVQPKEGRHWERMEAGVPMGRFTDECN